MHANTGYRAPRVAPEKAERRPLWRTCHLRNLLRGLYERNRYCLSEAHSRLLPFDWGIYVEEKGEGRVFFPKST